MEDQTEFTLSEKVSLADIIENEKYKFPILVYTCGNEQLDHRPDYDDKTLPLDTLMLLERRAVVSYAYMKVKPLESEAAAVEDKGAEFMVEYNGFVDEEFLVPLNYPVNVNIIHPPGRRRRYAEVSEIIADLPRFIRAELDTKTTPPPDMGEITTVRKGTVLEVTNVFQTEYENSEYLEGTAKDKTKYLFSEDTFVNFTAIPDTRLYSLPEVLTTTYLPKIVKFVEEPELEKVISSTPTWVNNTLVMTYAAMQLLGSEDREFYVCWLRDHSHDKSPTGGKKTFKIALIPKTRWKTEMVKLVKFNVSENKYAFLERKFPLVMNSEFINDLLYVIKPDKRLVTCLNSRVIMQEDEKPDRKRQQWGTDDTEVTEDTPDDIYDEPAPPIPGGCLMQGESHAESSYRRFLHDFHPALSCKINNARSPIVKEPPPPTTRHETPKLKADILHKIALKTKLGFGHVHKELLNVVHHAIPNRRKLKKSHSVPDKDETAKPARSQVKRSESDVSHLKSKTKKEKDRAQKTVASRERKDRGPLPELPSEDTPYADVEDNFVYDYPTIIDIHPPKSQSSTKREPSYQKVRPSDEAIVMKPNQTMEDFCGYSVAQVSMCFRLCALDNLGKICEAKRIDGAFLASFNLQDLKAEPFNLKEFLVRKVKLIIHDGWRPTYDSICKN